MENVHADFMSPDEALFIRHDRRPLRVLVSSTVYRKEGLLDRIYALLTSFGYEVWMSYAGTVHVNSNANAFENCLDAVRECDLFLGLITPDYGSGIDKDSSDPRSITHQEMALALELKKPRWMLVDSKIPFMRDWLNQCGIKTRAARKKFWEGLPKKDGRKTFDLRTIDIYEDVIQDYDPPRQVLLAERKGNWVQPFMDTSDVERFVVAQFYRDIQIETFLKENFNVGIVDGK